MNEYEKYLKEKLEIAEAKIESLYYQLSLERQTQAILEIERRKNSEIRSTYSGFGKVRKVEERSER
jgi:hypothetical protein